MWPYHFFTILLEKLVFFRSAYKHEVLSKTMMSGDGEAVWSW